MIGTIDVALRIKNYRCFVEPIEFILQKPSIAFLGKNNSGKTTLLRFLVEFRGLFTAMQSPGAIVNLLHGKKEIFGPDHTLSSINDIFANQNNRDLFINVNVENFEIQITVIRNTNSHSVEFFHKKIKIVLFENSSMQGKHLVIDSANTIDMTPMFDAFEHLGNTLYIGPFRNIVNSGGAQYYDINVGQSFIESWRLFKTGKSKPNHEAAVALTREIQQIFEYDSLEINASAENDTLQLFINGKSYRLAEVGSGIAQFIITLAHVAIKRPSFVLIDEPELNLHASLQLDFLTTLASYATVGIIFGTHNVGLARSAADDVYVVTRDSASARLKPFEKVARLSEVLGELNYSGYQALGFSKVLLVEGPTEIKTIQQYLRAFRKDHEIVLLHLGGSSLINGSREAELREILRICPNIYALIDSEKDSNESPLKEDRVQFDDCCQRCGIKCHILQRRATENYFTDRAVKIILGDGYSALSEFENLKKRVHSLRWSKELNWKIARTLTLEEIQSSDLGKFLKAL